MSQPTPTATAARPVSRLGFGGAHLDEYFGTWAIAFEHGHAMARHAERLNLRLHVARQEEQAVADRSTATVTAEVDRFGSGYGETLTQDGTAVIRVEGTLMKFAGSMSRGDGTVSLRRRVRRARADAGVQRVMLVIDSPGGTVAGTQDLADDVADLAAAKPTHAYVEDLMASAALWVGLQAGQVSAGRTSLVGSIGTLMAVADYSKLAAKQGIKVHVITSDEAAAHKGAGIAGTKITDQQLAEWRRTVNALQAHFTAAVAHGRGISTGAARKLADARVHLAADAKALGLIDHVEGFDEAMNRLRGTTLARKRGPRAEVPVTPPAADDGGGGGATTVAEQQTTDAGARAAGEQTQTAAAAAEEADPMANGNTTAGADATQTQQPERKPGTVAELKAACPGASSDFVLEQAEQGATVAEAKDAFIGWQAAQIRTRDEELTKARAQQPAEGQQQEQAEPTKAKTGVEPVKGGAAEQGGGAKGGGDPKADLEERVAKLTADGRMTRAAAVAKVFAADPGLRAAIRGA